MAYSAGAALGDGLLPWVALLSRSLLRHITFRDNRRVLFQQLYIACRVSTISQVITDLVGLGLSNQFNCKARFHACFTNRHLVHLQLSSSG